MMLRIKFLFLFLLAVTALVGQPDDEIGEQKFTITRDYDPVLADAVKERFTPKLPAPKSEDPDLTYNIPSKYLMIPYQAPDVRPLAMQHIQLDALDHVYAKIGFGNRALPMLDLYLNTGRKEMYANRDNNFNAGGHIGYINSGTGSLEHQKYTDLDIDAFFTFYKNKIAIGGHGGYYRDVTHFYGYDQEDTSFDRSVLRNRFNFFNVGFDINNAEKTYYNIDYDGMLDVNYFSDLMGRNEFNPLLDFSIKKKFKNDNFLSGGLKADYTNLTYDTVSQNSFFLSFNPVYRINKDNWFVNLGLKTGLYDEGFFILPDVEFERELIGRIIIFHAGAQGHIQKNNVKSLTDINPFLQKDIRIHNTRNIGVFAGIKGSPIQNLGYDLRVRYSNISYLPLFLNDTAVIPRFDVVYDTSAFVLNLHGEAGYSLSEKFRILLALDYYNYKLKNEVEAWHLPTFRASLQTSYTFSGKLTVGATVMGMNGRNAVVAENGNLAERELPGLIDVNLNASYKISDNFHVFAEFNNLTADKYERWANYPVYGFNALGGLVLIF